MTTAICLDLENKIEWSLKQKIDTKYGQKIIKKADVPEWFWGIWKDHKEEIKNQGYSVTKYEDTWQISKWENIEQKVKEEKPITVCGIAERFTEEATNLKAKKETIENLEEVEVTEEVKPKDLEGLIKLEEDTDSSQDSEKTIEEKPKSRFIRATSLKIIDEEGNELSRHKVIVNEAKHTQYFDIVGSGYKIAQHDEVVENIEEAIKELELTAEEDCILQIDEGARVHVGMKFPKIEITLDNGEVLTLRVSWDNSYNSTTGLRMSLDALNKKGYYLGTEFGKFYHRHTKGLDVKNLKRSLEKGIEVFKTKIFNQFQEMLNSKLDLPKVLTFLDKCGDEKIIAVKYIDIVKEKLNDLTYNEMDSQWALYNMVAEVLTARVESIDAQQRYMITMLNQIKKL